MVTHRRTLPAIFALAAVMGCLPDQPLLGSSDDPAVTLVLSRGPSITRAGPPDSTLHALVVTIGSPFAGFYRSIERFEMSRRSDGARFDWSVTDTTGPVDLARALELSRQDWNAHLAWRGTGGRLGREDLSPGETYDLEIETEGRLVTGSVRLPAAPTLSVASAGDDRIVTWPLVPGVTKYTIESQTDAFAFITTEGSYRLTLVDSTLAPPPGWLRVRGLEPNLADFSLGDDRRASGIVGAFGVFGAMSIDSVRIPPRGAAVFALRP